MIAAAAAPYLIGGAIQGGTALWQLMKANQLKKTPRPDYEIPQAAQDALKNAQMMASQKELPGQSLIEQKIAGGTANAIGQMKQAADSPAAILGGIGALQGKENNAYSDLALKAANYYAGNQAQLRGQLGLMGQYQNNQWQWDKQMPYKADMAGSSAMTGAALQNLYGMGQGLANAYGANKIMGTQGAQVGTMGGKIAAPTVSASGVLGVQTEAEKAQILAQIQALKAQLGNGGMTNTFSTGTDNLYK